MTAFEFLRIAVAVALTGVLVAAAVSDIRRRRIPNWTVLACLALFAPWAVTLTAGELGLAAAAFAIAGLGSVGLYAGKIVGAGDTKLFTVLAPFAGLALLPTYAAITAIAGALVAVAGLAAQPTRAYVVFQMRGAAPDKGTTPYGVGIAIAGIAVVWAQLLHFERAISTLPFN